MKIGILTFHRAENFGATLQAYALQTYLEGLGHEVYIIDYRCRAIEVNYHILNPSILWSRKNVLVSIKNYLIRFRNLKERIEKKQKYHSFWKQNFRLTKPFANQVQDLGFDAYIAGSDQIWNLHLTGGFDSNYFLGFVTDNNVKRISYAASAEIDVLKLKDKYKTRISRLLSQFKAISVREEFLKNELRSFTDKEIRVCLDPTFLVGKEEYLQILKQPIEKEYILVYHMHLIPEGTQLAENIAKKTGESIIEIYGGYVTGITNNSRFKMNLSPDELLGYIVYANKIITSSFHGLALSLIFNKDVWVINKGNNLRQKHLLNLLQIEHRLLNSIDDYKDSKIDYTQILVNLNTKISDSKYFLQTALND